MIGVIRDGALFELTMVDNISPALLYLNRCIEIVDWRNEPNEQNSIIGLA